MNKKLRYMMLCLSLFAFGCNDWLDVQPKSQVKLIAKWTTIMKMP